MTLAASDLRPYASLVLLQIHGRDPGIQEIVSECEQAMPFADDPQLNPVAGPIYPQRPGLDLGVLVYEERRPPAWLADSDEIRDLLNHLLVVARRDRLVALYMSDPRRRAAVVRRLEAANGGRSWHLEAIDPRLLNAAFVRGPARTLWLSGIHVQVTSRADSKVLSGMDLRDALDPLGDQSYYFTAARSTVPELRLPVGVSPRGSRVWVGASRDWDHFCDTVERVVGTLGGTSEPVREPLPVVAVPCDRAPGLADAFDLHLIPPELLAEDAGDDPQDRELIERWGLRSSFRILDPHDPLAGEFEPLAGKVAADGRAEVPITFEVDLEGRPLALARIVLDATDPGRVEWTTPDVRSHPAAGGDPVQQAIDLDELRKLLRRRRWLRVWFESGHTLSDGVIFEVRHRDLPFEGYSWADFHGYHVETEKFWKGTLEDESGVPAIDRIGTRLRRRRDGDCRLHPTSTTPPAPRS